MAAPSSATIISPGRRPARSAAESGSTVLIMTARSWVNPAARRRSADFRFRVLFRQPVELRLQNFSYAIFEARSLSGKPVIERGCDSVEIFEEALAVGLDEVTGIRCGIGARLDDCKRIDPALPNIDANAVATDLYEAGNVSIDDTIEFRK